MITTAAARPGTDRAVTARVTARTYTDAEKTEALEVYVAEGLAAAHHRLSIPRATLRDWAQRAGLDTAELAGATRERVAQATESRIVYRDGLREEIRTKLLEGVDLVLDRLAVSDESSRDLQPLAIAAGILIDKYRLEMGEATGRNENLHGDARATATSALDELRAKRAAKEATA